MEKDFFEWAKVKTDVQQRDEPFFYERELWWCSLGTNVGNETNGKNDLYERPVLIVKKFNKTQLWAVPLTTRRAGKKSNRYYVETNSTGRTAHIVLSQLRTVSSKRLTRKMGTMGDEEFRQVVERVKQLFP